MKLHRLAAGMLAAIAFDLAGASPALAADRTARAALPQVLAAARGWQGDAALVSLSSVSVREDGTAAEWRYSFYSVASGKRCVVTAGGSGVRTREVRLGFSTEPLGEFIDSDAAMRQAKKNGLKGSEPNMAVKHWGSGASAGVYWIVAGGLAKGDVAVFLEAKTGKFFSRSAVE